MLTPLALADVVASCAAAMQAAASTAAAPSQARAALPISALLL